jgi:hypothetical protein
MFIKDGHCPRCAKRINPAKAKWLEQNNCTGMFVEPGTVPADESQGWFEFGADCARAILKNGGKLVCVGAAA